MRDWWDHAGAVIDVMSGKWVIPVLRALDPGPLRHNELKRAIGRGLHTAVFDNTLRRMERAGLVERRIRPGTPPAVSYGLTELARSLFGPLAEVAQWTKDHQEELKSHPAWS